ncbi:hypothetical protein [Rhizobium rhizosphaerae]|uniref:hypothetical protein n=1 Tax=Xaviernesmea rhizosphaerae TaxID=1672749 RepID=UPI00111A2267|nr:hypothetical protein [Xaviernesmea rhizosphaerae]
MTLVGLIVNLSATRGKLKPNNMLRLFLPQLVGLSAEVKRQAGKKANEINACRLVELVAPTGDAAADKRRPPCSRLNRSSGQDVSRHFLDDTSHNPKPKTAGGLT